MREERRGRWSFYSLDREVAQRLIAEMYDSILPENETTYVL